MTLSKSDSKFIERIHSGTQYLPDLKGMRVYVKGGSRSARSILNAIRNKIFLGQKVLVKF